MRQPSQIDGWSTVHDRHFARLTDAWQRLDSLKETPTSGDYGYSDLVDFGVAEELREPIFKHGIRAGTRLSFRRLN